MTPIPDSERQFVLAQLLATSGVMMKEFLRRRGLAASSSGRVDDQAERLLRYVEEGTLTLSDVDSYLLDFRESNAKIVRLYSCLEADDHASIVGGLMGPSGSVPNASMLRYSFTTDLAYAIASETEVKMVFTEQHVRIVPNKRERRWETQMLDITVVMRYWRASRRLWIALDKPGDEHPHGTSADDYFQSYELLAAAKLSLGLTRIDLNPALVRLDHKPNVSILKHRSVEDGIRNTRVVDGYTTMSAAPAFRDHIRLVTLRHGGEFLWNPTSDTIDGQRSLLRPVRARVDTKSASVAFVQHTLSFEIDHVIADLMAE